MLRLSVYHWLPIADNMLPEIEQALMQQTKYKINNIRPVPDAVLYDVKFHFAQGSLTIKGKINQRGFSQNVIGVPEISNRTLSGALETIIPQIRGFLVDLLFDIVPQAVKNKLAVLYEGIVSFQEFEANIFEPLIDIPAKSFLYEYQFMVLLIGKEKWGDIESGFDVPSIDLEVKPSSEKERAVVNCKANCVLFYADVFHDQEQQELDGIVYKYSALITYLRFVSRVVFILKEVRDHVIPLRRQLTVALQKNTDEYFSLLTRMKKYLTYVNIKLPVVQKVLNHLNAAKRSAQFAEKVVAFVDNEETSSRFPSIRSINRTDYNRLKPIYVITKIDEDYTRLQALYEEDQREIQVISDELSQVLEGSLLAEDVQISARKLDTSLSALELDRGGKNRANALKIFSILVAANLGFAIAAEFGAQKYLKLLVGLTLTLISWLVTNMIILNKSSSMRVVAPINATVPRASLSKLIQSKDLKRAETSGSRRTCTWIETFEIIQPNSKIQLRRQWHRRVKFDVTVDYQKRGYIHSIAIAAEYNKIQFDVLDLMMQIFGEMEKSGCFSEYKDTDISLFAQVLSNLEVFLNNDLIALNRILNTPSAEIEQVLKDFQDNREHNSISMEDRMFFGHIVQNKAIYLDWLSNVQKGKMMRDRALLELLGEKNVRKKYEVISHIVMED